MIHDNNHILAPTQLPSIVEVNEEDIINSNSNSPLDEYDENTQPATVAATVAAVAAVAAVDTTEVYTYKNMAFQSLKEVEAYFDEHHIKGFVITSSKDDSKALGSSVYIDKTNNYIQY